MNLVTFSVTGTDEALLSIQQGLTLAIDSTWRKGDVRRSGAQWEVAGFSATIVDAVTPAELEKGLRDFLTQCGAHRVIFALPEIEANLSIGVTVGDSQQFIASIDLSPELLSAMAACGVSVSFTAYPTSDEADAADSI